MEAERPHRLRVGRVVRPHGLAGEVVVRQSTFTAEEFRALGEVRLVRPNGEVALCARPSAVRDFNRALLVTFAAVTDSDQAAELRGTWVEIDAAALPDPGPGQVYHQDLMGLEVVEEDGRVLGRVANVLVTGAHEVLQIETGEGELMIPYHAEVVRGWDRAAGRLTVRLPAGLEDIYRSNA